MRGGRAVPVDVWPNTVVAPNDERRAGPSELLELGTPALTDVERRIPDALEVSILDDEIVDEDILGSIVGECGRIVDAVEAFKSAPEPELPGPIFLRNPRAEGGRNPLADGDTPKNPPPVLWRLLLLS